MTKQLWLAGSVLLSVGLNAQVGINAGQKTDAPQYQEIAKDAVLQVANKQGEHKGVLLPSVSLNSTTDQSSITKDGASTVTKGLLVWCDGQGIGADKLAEGYYYWDGAQWVKIGGATAVSAPARTLYTSNGALTGDRTIDIGDHTLKIQQRFGQIAIGRNVRSTGRNSLAVGLSTTASGNFSTAMGKYNADHSENILSVGVGTGDNARKNAFVVDQGGNVAIGKDKADRSAGAAKLQVKGSIQSEGINDLQGGATDKMVVADANGNLKTVERVTATNNLYTSNGTLTGDRTVDQNDHNLTISTGLGNLKIEGKTIIASAVSVDPNVAGVPSYQLHSNGLATAASKGRNIRVYNGTSAPDYADSDYMIVLTNDGVDGSLHLPSASKYPGRIIYLLNGTTQGLGFSSTGTEDVYPFNFGTIAVSAGVGFVSTGKTWYVIGR